jgi:hypothetical protein
MANDISKTSIINLALANLGQKLISSADENTQTARTAGLMYDFVRRTLLRAHDWAFSLQWAELAASTVESPSLTLPYVFALPSNNLFVKKLSYEGIPLHHQLPYLLFNDEQGNKLIACPYENAKLLYVKDEDNTALFDPAFVACFALLLAAELAVPLAGDSNLAQLMLSKYQSKLDEARQTNKIEQFEVPEKISAFLEAR